MKKIYVKYKKELEIILIVIIESILFSILSMGTKSLNLAGTYEENQLITAGIMILADIMIFSIFDMLIMKKVKDDKKIDIIECIQQYPKIVIINFIICFITYELGYAIVMKNNTYSQIHSSDATLMFVGLTSMFLYMVKMFLGFAPHEAILNNQKIGDSFFRSIRLVSKNLGRVLFYNIVYIFLAYIVMIWNKYYMETYGILTVYNVINEITLNAIFATNALLYVNVILQRKDKLKIIKFDKNKINDGIKK